MSLIPLAVETPVICNFPLAYLKSSISLLIINASAKLGMPCMPNCVETIPSFMLPNFEKLFSIGC